MKGILKLIKEISIKNWMNLVRVSDTLNQVLYDLIKNEG